MAGQCAGGENAAAEEGFGRTARRVHRKPEDGRRRSHRHDGDLGAVLAFEMEGAWA